MTDQKLTDMTDYTTSLNSDTDKINKNVPVKCAPYIEACGKDSR